MQQIFQYIHNSLSGIYDESEIRTISFLLIEKLTEFSRTEILTNKSTNFSANQQQKLDGFIEKLKKNIPIQYILGETEFFGLNFVVDKSVLIPRPETEELVEWICTSLSPSLLERDLGRGAPRILDIGTGSGCIAVALKNKLPNAELTAFDISEQALQTARKNAERNKVSVDFRQVDILKENTFAEKWDVIVSNPPYIPERERANMCEKVWKNEPELALFVPDETPLLFYEKIAHFAQNHLTNNGKLFFEIHFDAGNAVVDLLKTQHFKNIEIRKDISGNARMVKCAKM